MRTPLLRRTSGLLTIGFTLVAFVSATPFTLSAEETNPPFEFHKPASQWPKGDYTIIPSAKSRQNKQNVDHLGPTGLWGFPFGQNICVLEVDPGSPADGKVLPDDFIYGANGKEFPAERDVRFYFGNAITEAETREAGGKLTLHVRRNGELITVPIQLQVMGSFSATTPWNCEKSKNIVARAEEYMLKGLRPETGIPNNGRYMYGPFHDSVLFLMASGNPKLQGLVRRQIHSITKALDAHKAGEKGAFSADKGWAYCYLKLLFGEYYHRTGDPTVLPYLEDMCRASDWSPPTGPGQYGLHPHMQMPDTMGMVLANEAGLNINKDKMVFDLKFLNVGRAEHGWVKYFGYGKMTQQDRQSQAPEEITDEQKAEGTYSNMNGKLGTAAALFSLVDGYEKSVEMCATRCVYSFNVTHKGHGGVWFNGFWSPIGAYHAGPKKAQLFMKGQQWWRELYRDHTGAMWQTGNANGKSDTLGTGFAIHRVMPYKRLRMLGAPRSYFCPNPPPSMKPALEAHRKRDYAQAEKLILELQASGKVPDIAKDRVNHFLESVQTLKKSIEHDLAFTEALIKKGNYVLASVELPQLQMVVSPDNARLKAIARVVESSKAKEQFASAIADAERKRVAAIKAKGAAKADRKEDFDMELASIDTLVKDSQQYLGPYIGRRGRGIQCKYRTYPKNELNRWRLHEMENLDDAPKGWEQPTFDDSKWKEIDLPNKTKRNGKPSLLRTHFEVKDVSAFKSLRIRMSARGLCNVTFYLNGGIVGVGDSGFKQAFSLKPEALALLREGKNTMAISFHRSAGSSFTGRLEGLRKSPLAQEDEPPDLFEVPTKKKQTKKKKKR